MRHRLATLTPEVDRETLTLYGGLFALTIMSVGLSIGQGFNPLRMQFLPEDPALTVLSGVVFGFWPALLVMLFVRLHRYAYPPEVGR